MCECDRQAASTQYVELYELLVRGPGKLRRQSIRLVQYEYTIKYNGHSGEASRATSPLGRRRRVSYDYSAGCTIHTTTHGLGQVHGHVGQLRVRLFQFGFIHLLA